MTAKSLFAALAIAGVGTAVLAGVRVELDKVPAAAVKTIKARFPKAEIRFVDKENTGIFEFAMKEGDRQFDVGVAGDGKLVNVKEEVAEKDIPAAVKTAVLKKYPGTKIIEAEKVTRGDGKDARTIYELLIQTGKGKQTVKYDPTGKEAGSK